MFRRAMRGLLISSLFTGALWAADDPFVGNWKLNPSRSKMTDVMKVESLGGNKYSFDFGGNPEVIVVDGTDQAGIFGTTLSVSSEAPDSWKVVRKKDGHLLVVGNWKLSPDGSTLTDDYTGYNPNGSTYNLKYQYKRKGEGSGFAATWVSISEAVNSVFVLQVKPYENDGLSFINPSQEQTMNMKFDGKDYAVLGPNVLSGSTSSIRRLNDHALEVAYKINGKPIYTQQVELSDDLKTLTMTLHREGRDEPNVRVFERQ